jgi:threonine aldolase
MRFISAQFSAFFKDDLWLNLANHSNQMAQKLLNGLEQFKQVQITQPVQVNGIFCIFPEGIAEKLQAKFPFYIWNEETNEVRLMTSWDTQNQDIEDFLSELKSLLS